MLRVIRDHHADDEFGDCAQISAGQVDHRNAVPGGRGQVDVDRSAARHPDGPKSLRRIEERRP